MAFYDLSSAQRAALAETIYQDLQSGLQAGTSSHFHALFSDDDTYIRKAAYLAVGRLYISTNCQERSIGLLRELFLSESPLVRQTVVNAMGEIGKTYAEPALELLEAALFDPHHKVRNAVIGSLKKMGEVNSVPVLHFVKRFVHHPSVEVRRQVVHGMELRGRTHPEEVLPLLAELQDESRARVRNMVMHVLGQISYKKGCLEKVLAALQTWHNRAIVQDALDEILETHESYKNFSYYSPEEAQKLIEKLQIMNGE